MAKVANKGGPQFMSRALRPGGGGAAPPPRKKFDLGSLKGPKDVGPGGPTKIGKGIANNPNMKPPSFGGRPSPRKR
jgi:hypothetical protein